jgi:ubiquinone biosynthesis protein
VLPTSIALLIKVLVMLEGTSRLLNPNFDLMGLLQPYQKKLIWRYLSPARRLQKFRRLMQEWRYLGEILPRSLVEILQQFQHNRFEVHLEHKHLDTGINRLTFGIVTSALFVGSALLLSSKVPPTLADISVFGALGTTFSFFLALRLLWAIKNSGRLD